MNVFDLSFESGKVAFTQLVRLNLSSVSCNDPFADVLTYLSDFILLLMLLLNFIVFHVLSCFPLLAMLIVVAEGWSVPSNLNNLILRWHVHHVSVR